MSKWIRASVFCATIPLGLGLAIFLAWLICRLCSSTVAVGLMTAGLFLIPVGSLSVLVGLACLVFYLYRSARSASVPPRTLRRHGLVVGGMLLANFPVAIGLTVAGIAIDTMYTVTIINDSGRPVQTCRIVGGGVDIDFGTVPAGQKGRKRFWIRRDGELELRAQHGQMQLRETIDGYVTHNMDGCTDVTISPGGKVQVEHVRP